MLFLYEGWPLCLRDQVVIHLSPINPLLLQPGDFYLQVVPFCHQSARIVICSLLEQEGFRGEVVEETPVPETSYPSIFSCDWLDELNRGRHGTPLSRCLLATERGVVRLPWERVAVPDFVDVERSAGRSMASAPPSYPPLSPQLPSPPPLPDFPENSSSDKSFPLSPSKESAPKQYPVTILASSSHPSAFSVETRICQAKHGIAVSLCLVDASAAASSRLVKVKEAEAEPKPIGWVSPNTWDSRFTGTNPKTRTVSDTCTPASDDTCKAKSLIVPENKQQDTKLETSKSAPSIVAEGDYIDVLQAAMLFGRTRSLAEDQQKSEVQMQPNVEAQMQRYPPRQAQMQPHAQRQAGAQIQHHAQQPQAHMGLPTDPAAQSQSRSVSSRPSTSAETHPPSHHHSQPNHSSCPEAPQCVRTVRFSEKPCTPCMKRRQGGKVTRAQELRCRYRDSYQAAIQNPVTFGPEKERGNMLAVVEEDADVSQCDDAQGLADAETRDPWCSVQDMWCVPGVQNQSPSSVSKLICEESGEKSTVPYWKPGDTNTAPCMEYRGMNALPFTGLPEQTNERTTALFREPQGAHSSKSYLHNVNGTNSAAETRINTARAPSSLNGPNLSDEHVGLPFSSSEVSGMHVALKPRENSTSAGTSQKSHSMPQNRRECVTDGRCSSLSTAVVDTSEKCAVVIVEGQNVRRRENTDSCAEIPQLHVVKCKNSTAFRLVSPKTNRRKLAVSGILVS